MTRIELPFPVPLSACFKDVTFKSKAGQTFRKRAPTSRYEKWQKEALGMITQQRPAPVLGQVAVLVRLKAPDKRERDAGNCDKAVMDILVKAGLITNDSNRYIRRLTFAWVDEGSPCEVFIKPIEAVA